MPRQVRNEKYEEPCDWYLSGIGRNDGFQGWDCLVPTEPDYDARKIEDWPDEWPDENHFDAALAYSKSYQMFVPMPVGVPTSTKPYRRDVTEILYPMHTPCWEMFLQNHALHATREPLRPNLSKLAEIFAAQDLEEGYRGLIPSWAGDYAGPERFWSDGWAYRADGASEVVELLEAAPEWDFLVHDPGNVQGFTELLENPPLASKSSNPSSIIPWKGHTRDPFSRLPTELLMEILCLLPTSSGQALRLASRAMASVTLSSSFWRSRFHFPNELCHIRLPQRLQAGPQVDTMAVDWRGLCYRLLHSSGESWQNRKRIMTLNEKLVRMMLAEEDDMEEES